MKTVISALVLFISCVATVSFAKLPSEQLGCYSADGSVDFVCQNYSVSQVACEMAPPHFGCIWKQRDTSGDFCRGFCGSTDYSPQAQNNCGMFSESVQACVDAPPAFNCYWSVRCNEGL